MSVAIALYLVIVVTVPQMSPGPAPLSLTLLGTMERSLGIQLSPVWAKVGDLESFTHSKRQCGACTHFSPLAPEEEPLARWAVLVLDLKHSFWRGGSKILMILQKKRTNG